MLHGRSTQGVGPSGDGCLTGASRMRQRHDEQAAKAERSEIFTKAVPDVRRKTWAP